MPYLLALISAACYGANIFCTHAGTRLGKVDSNQVLIINLVSGTLFLSLVEAGILVKSGLPRISWAGIAFFVASGLGGPFLGRMFSIRSIQRIGGTRTASLRMSEIFITILLAFLILGERIPPIAFLGAAVLLGGILLLVNKKKNPGPTAEPDRHSPPAGSAAAALSLNPGIVLPFVSALFFAGSRIFSQLGLNEMPSPILGALCGTVAAVISNSLVLAVSGHLKARWQISPRQLFFFILSGIGGSLGLLLLMLAMNMGGLVSLVGALKNTSPLFTLMLSWLFLKDVEKIDAGLIASILLIVAGAVLIVL